MIAHYNFENCAGALNHNYIYFWKLQLFKVIEQFMYILKIFGIWEVKQTWISHTVKNTSFLFSIGIWKPNLIFVCHFLQASLVFFKDITSFPISRNQKVGDSFDFLMNNCTLWFGIRMLKTKKHKRIFYIFQLVGRNWKTADTLIFNCIISKKGNSVKWLW